MTPDYGRGESRSYDERVSLRVGEDLVSDVEELVEEGVFDSRSEAFRELVNRGVDVVRGER